MEEIKLLQSEWAKVTEESLKSFSGELPYKMVNSDATGLPLLCLKNKKFGADIIRFAPGKKVAQHIHKGDHILLVTKGIGTLGYYGKKYNLKPGIIYMVPGNIPHAIYADKGEELVLIAIGNDHYPVDSPKRLDLIDLEK